MASCPCSSPLLEGTCSDVAVCANVAGACSMEGGCRGEADQAHCSGACAAEGTARVPYRVGAVGRCQSSPQAAAAGSCSALGACLPGCRPCRLGGQGCCSAPEALQGTNPAVRVNQYSVGPGLDEICAVCMQAQRALQQWRRRAVRDAFLFWRALVRGRARFWAAAELAAAVHLQRAQLGAFLAWRHTAQARAAVRQEAHAILARVQQQVP